MCSREEIISIVGHTGESSRSGSQIPPTCAARSTRSKGTSSALSAAAAARPAGPAPMISTFSRVGIWWWGSGIEGSLLPSRAARGARCVPGTRLSSGRTLAILSPRPVPRRPLVESVSEGTPVPAQAGHATAVTTAETPSVTMIVLVTCARMT